ncbi:MAG: 16S rRNA (guanine(966)-N(2))-methyltransferase RsmD [Actinomycetota bacterium]|nr:16S rRNA (guanine(966)-N(2))-methyltransferase RsmD [Actinomycetota bacterium]
MRVIGGTHGGRRFDAVPGKDVRPTSDRTREAVFNILFSMGFPQDAVVVDAFAGTGALGIEALSRGAASVVFIEQHARACASIERNLSQLALRGRVLRADALEAVARVEPDPDLVLVDPPYDFDDWDTFLRRCPAATVVIESDRPIDPDPDSWWEVVRQKKYGRATITILAPSASSQ